MTVCIDAFMTGVGGAELTFQASFMKKGGKWE